MVLATPKKVKAVIFRRARKARERPEIFWQNMFYISGGWYYFSEPKGISLDEALENEPDIMFFDDFGKFNIVVLAGFETDKDGEVVLGKRMTVKTWPFKL